MLHEEHRGYEGFLEKCTRENVFANLQVVRLLPGGTDFEASIMYSDIVGIDYL
mgnify:CR=1 FL=1